MLNSVSHRSHFLYLTISEALSPAKEAILERPTVLTRLNKGFCTGSVKGVMGHMATAHTRNANFLLNVAPNRSGQLVPESIKVLKEIGKMTGHGKVEPNKDKQ